jgi:hypothetical protein
VVGVGNEVFEDAGQGGEGGYDGEDRCAVVIEVGLQPPIVVG